MPTLCGRSTSAEAGQVKDLHHKQRYSLIEGLALIHALMAVVEEIIIILIYLGVG
jgi:hypothetical protein